jgi:hypothetical protein
MFEALRALFRKSDSKPPLALQKARASKAKPKVAPTQIGELGEHKINIQLDQLPKDCKFLSDLLLPNPKSLKQATLRSIMLLYLYIVYLLLRRKWAGGSAMVSE